jgi:hypothetical protein
MTTDLERYYSQSYPPSVLAGGGGSPVQAVAQGGEPEDEGDGVPTEANTKIQIQEWLDDRGISYSTTETKAQLLEKVAQAQADDSEPEPIPEPGVEPE